jgi:sugar phosphate isomerase/epimerase
MNRRDFLGGSLLGAASLGLPRVLPRAEPLFRISLAEWSFHRALQSGTMNHLDFATRARKEYDLDAVEYVNTFFFERANDRGYLGTMKSRAESEGVRSLLIMCDSEGDLGSPGADDRRRAVENHYKWLEAASFLGCHSIRVNARSDAALDASEQEKLAADGLRRLCERAEDHGLNVLVENHGGISSNGAWLASVMKRVSHPRIGTLPDFGNFRIRTDPEEWYDRYQGVRELMPFAKAVSAKSHDFDDAGNETSTDYARMMSIVLEAGYHGYVGIEYEGERLSEPAGVELTRKLLLRVRDARPGVASKH